LLIYPIAIIAKTIEITIKESEVHVQYLLCKQEKFFQQSRVKALLMVNQGKVNFTYELSNK
jgi:hypothetical protein